MDWAVRLAPPPQNRHDGCMEGGSRAVCFATLDPPNVTSLFALPSKKLRCRNVVVITSLQGHLLGYLGEKRERIKG